MNFDNLITSINENILPSKSFKIYPNPATNTITISLTNPNDEEHIITIFNIMGIKTKSFTIKQNTTQIDISDIENGIYFIELKSSENLETKSLLIHR